MGNNKTNLESIISKASSLAEHLAGRSHQFLITKDELKIDERLQDWCQVVAKGDGVKFKKYLEWRDLDINKIRVLLNDHYTIEDESYPKWALTLEKIIDKAQQIYDKQAVFDFYLEDNNIPFIPFYLPLVEVGMELLLDLVGEKISLLEKTAKLELKHSLLKILDELCVSTLISEFDKFRSSDNDSKNNLLYYYVIGLNKHRHRYNEFIQNLFRDGLYSLFSEYSVLGKLIGTVINYWVEAKSEFIHHLSQDWSDIERCFSPDGKINKVVKFAGNLSDTHNQGKTVICLTFDTGMKLIYKPRSLSLDTAFYKFQDWCNQYSGLLDLKTLKLLSHSNYGWVEYVESLPCETEESVRFFYIRVGMLLCIAYILNGNDFHYENLIAHGDQPVLIDLETLMTQDAMITNLSQKKSTLNIANMYLMESVLQTFILPRRGLSDADEQNYDAGGLGGKEEQTYEYIPNYLNINTDGMCLTYTASEQPRYNVPKLAGNSCIAKEYLAEVVVGFEQMYRFLLSKRNVLLGSDSPIVDMVGQKVRYLFRATKVYAWTLKDSWRPHLLRSGLDRSIALEILSRAFLTSDEKPLYWPMLEAELQGMDEDLDIPYFCIDSSSRDLSLSTGTVIQNQFEKSSFDNLIARINKISEEDLAQQIDIIQKSFYGRFNKEPQQNCEETKIDTTQVLSEDKSAIATQLLEQAIIIGQELQQRAIYTDNDNIIWSGLRYTPKHQDFNVGLLGYNLYDGMIGLALFFAGLFRVTKDVQWQKLVVKSLQPYHQLILEDLNSVEKINRFITQESAHGLRGIAANIYALIKISQLLENPGLLEIARKIATWITIDAINADEKFNILEGSAGTLLSLLELYEIETDEQSTASPLLKKAIACGEHLLQHQTSIDNLPKAWQNWQDKQLTGFSQGTAGIAYALLRLFAVTQDERFLAGASEAISYEQRHFSDEFHNWPDLRAENPCFRVSFSQGAPGIALGRLGGLSIRNNEQMDKDIEIALETTQRYILGDVDNLCWGNFGRLETLLVAAKRLDRLELLEFVQGVARHITNQAKVRGTFIFSSNFKAYDPGFFHGSTGIGYQLLRIAYPDLLPSILLWE
ncbi:type 2 lanthipeptide synthetase LanM family protein [Cylindrospermum sp. FACHB-282]|uniref:type 2 lanthipeptide synthetase LanM family protein n=1 Tax=Cylindrospermum sp. FACHB-282 TaxID=2692794 RepID=UPI00168A3E30|nr:type 2 lanthipeptide synthetase LanM family protein [Cylindrospermum sp. FACHB-282]MBD2387090.1 type 2 lantipeptide synthetase LanM [Cylindrospermum sp. FACHB-282]